MEILFNNGFLWHKACVGFLHSLKYSCKLFYDDCKLFSHAVRLIGGRTIMNEINRHNELNAELNMVYRYLRKLSISKADAEDSVQEAAYKYLLYYDTIKIAKIRSWLIRVALNSYYDQCRKRGRYDLNLDEGLLKTEQKEQPEAIFLNKERNIEIGKAISQLKPLFQELLLLKYHLGLTYEEISKILEINHSSIKTNLFRARKKFERIYKEAIHE